MFGSPTLKALVEMQSQDRRNPKLLMAICRWQRAQGRCFLHEHSHRTWSRNTKALRAVESNIGGHGVPLRSVHQFFEVCGKNWQKSLEPLTLWKLDRDWKRSAQQRDAEQSGQPDTTCQAICHWT